MIAPPGARLVHAKCTGRHPMGSRNRHARTGRRQRIGRVSTYEHHGGYWTYHREAGKPVRRSVGGSAALAECEASLINARLVAAEAGLDLRAVQAARELTPLLGEGPAARCCDRPDGGR